MIVAVEMNPEVWYPYVIEATVDVSCEVETYVALPKPATVDAIVVLRKDVDVRFSRLGLETNPAVW